MIGLKMNVRKRHPHIDEKYPPSVERLIYRDPRIPPICLQPSIEDVENDKELLQRLSIKTNFLKALRRKHELSKPILYSTIHSTKQVDKPSRFGLSNEVLDFSPFVLNETQKKVLCLTNLEPFLMRFKVVPPLSSYFWLGETKFPSSQTNEVATGNSVSIEVFFSSSKLEIIQDEITIISGIGSSKCQLIARPVPPVLTVVPPSSVPQLFIGESATQSISLTNRGGPTHFKFSSSHPLFRLKTDQVFLQANESFTEEVWFTSNDPGTFSGTFSITTIFGTETLPLSFQVFSPNFTAAFSSNSLDHLSFPNLVNGQKQNERVVLENLTGIDVRFQVLLARPILVFPIQIPLTVYHFKYALRAFEDQDGWLIPIEEIHRPITVIEEKPCRKSEDWFEVRESYPLAIEVSSLVVPKHSKLILEINLLNERLIGQFFQFLKVNFLYKINGLPQTASRLLSVSYQTQKVISCVFPSDFKVENQLIKTKKSIDFQIEFDCAGEQRANFTFTRPKHFAFQLKKNADFVEISDDEQPLLASGATLRLTYFSLVPTEITDQLTICIGNSQPILVPINVVFVRGVLEIESTEDNRILKVGQTAVNSITVVNRLDIEQRFWVLDPKVVRKPEDLRQFSAVEDPGQRHEFSMVVGAMESKKIDIIGVSENTETIVIEKLVVCEFESEGKLVRFSNRFEKVDFSLSQSDFEISNLSIKKSYRFSELGKGRIELKNLTNHGMTIKRRVVGVSAGLNIKMRHDDLFLRENSSWDFDFEFWLDVAEEQKAKVEFVAVFEGDKDDHKKVLDVSFAFLKVKGVELSISTDLQKPEMRSESLGLSVGVGEVGETKFLLRNGSDSELPITLSLDGADRLELPDDLTLRTTPDEPVLLAAESSPSVSMTFSRIGGSLELGPRRLTGFKTSAGAAAHALANLRRRFMAAGAGRGGKAILYSISSERVTLAAGETIELRLWAFGRTAGVVEASMVAEFGRNESTRWPTVVKVTGGPVTLASDQPHVRGDVDSWKVDFGPQAAGALPATRHIALKNRGGQKTRVFVRLCRVFPAGKDCDAPRVEVKLNDEGKAKLEWVFPLLSGDSPFLPRTISDNNDSLRSHLVSSNSPRNKSSSAVVPQCDGFSLESTQIDFDSLSARQLFIHFDPRPDSGLGPREAVLVFSDRETPSFDNILFTVKLEARIDPPRLLCCKEGKSGYKFHRFAAHPPRFQPRSERSVSLCNPGDAEVEFVPRVVGPFAIELSTPGPTMTIPPRGVLQIKVIFKGEFLPKDPTASVIDDSTSSIQGSLIIDYEAPISNRLTVSPAFPPKEIELIGFLHRPKLRLIFKETGQSLTQTPLIQLGQLPLGKKRQFLIQVDDLSECSTQIEFKSSSGLSTSTPRVVVPPSSKNSPCFVKFVYEAKREGTQSEEIKIIGQFCDEIEITVNAEVIDQL